MTWRAGSVSMGAMNVECTRFETECLRRLIFMLMMFSVSEADQYDADGFVVMNMKR